MIPQPPSLPVQHNVFHEIQTETVTKHARLVEIGQPQIWKPMKLSLLEKRIQQTLLTKDIIRKWPKLREWIRAFGVVFMSRKVNFYVRRSALIDADLWHNCYSF